MTAILNVVSSPTGLSVLKKNFLVLHTNAAAALALHTVRGACPSCSRQHGHSSTRQPAPCRHVWQQQGRMDWGQQAWGQQAGGLGGDAAAHGGALGLAVFTT